jgi:AraC-like DNA-binding protein/mannose-6-phosphate isomerase-like protein (cupin superfamily)
MLSPVRKPSADADPPCPVDQSRRPSDHRETGREMVENGHRSTVRQLSYQPRDSSAGGVEVMSFARLRALNDGATQRADFYVIAIVDAGRGAVSIDFERYPLGPGAVVRIPPGAVHRWDNMVSVSGRLVLFVSTAPVTPVTRALAAPTDPPGVCELAAEAALVRAALDHLELELHAAGVGVRAEIPVLLLSAFLARLPVTAAAGAAAVGSLFNAFRRELEVNFRAHHDAGFYARILGYSPRTLSRAVQRATGRTAKAYIVERVLLEAKRMLAHDRFTAARCARELGFPDASGFSAFFHHGTGMPAGAWQQRAASTSPGSPEPTASPRCAPKRPRPANRPHDPRDVPARNAGRRAR